MKKYSKEDILRQFEVSCDILYHSDETGDYKTGNKEQRKLVKIFKYFENNTVFAVDCLRELLQNESVVVSNRAAGWLLSLNEKVDEALKVLLLNSEKKEAGVFRFEAEMTLKVWKSQGYLRVYKDQEIRRYEPGDNS